MAPSRQTMARLKKLLLARDVDLIVQGVEFVTALDDEEIWDVLLAGVDWTPPREVVEPHRTLKIPAAWVPNALFDGTGPAQPYHDLALTLLVAHAPSSALRDRVTHLRIAGGTGTWPRHPFPRLPLEGIERYPNLRGLSIETATETDLGPVTGCAALESLEVTHGGPIELPPLRSCTRLRSLTIGARLESTAGVEGAPLERVSISSDVLRDLRGLGDTPVRTVELRAGPHLDFRGLARARSLETLSLTYGSDCDLTGLAGSPLQRLECNWQSSVRLPTLANLSKVAVGKLVGTEVQPALTSLVLYNAGDRVPPVASTFPALEELTLQSPDLDDAECLRGATHLRTLRISSGRIADPAALGSLTGLQALQLDGVDLGHLDALPPTRLVKSKDEPLSWLELRGSIRSIRGVGKLQGIQILALSDCTKLETLEGIEGSDVRALDLRGCSALRDVSALAELPELRMVALRGTMFHEGNVPAGVGPAVTLVRFPDLLGALRRPAVRAAPPPDGGKPKKKVRSPVPAAQRAAWEELQPLLIATEEAGVQRLVDWLAANGTAEMLDLLLGAVVQEGWEFTVRGRLLAAEKSVRQVLVRRLIALGTGQRAQQLLAETRVLRIRPWRARGSWGPGGVADLRGIGAFRALEQLHVDDAGGVTGLEELDGHPSLRELSVSGSASIAGIGVLPALTSLKLTAEPGLPLVRNLPALESLSTGWWRASDLSGLTGHPRLANVQIMVQPTTDLRPLTTLPRLRRLKYDGPPLPSFAGSPTLEALEVSPEGWADTRCLADLPVRSLEVDFRNAAGLQLAPLQGLPRLERLILRGYEGSLDMLPRSLARLELWHGKPDLGTLPEMTVRELACTDPGDLSGLGRLSGLEVLDLHHGSGGNLSDLAPLRALSSLHTLKLNPSWPVSLEPLRGHPALKVVQISQWSLRYAQIPADLQPLVSSP